jgi:hypothetical protein
MSSISKIWIAALIAMLMPGAALAEQIIIIKSYHNLDYASVACSNTNNPEGIAECKLFTDGRNLGRRLENEVRSQMAANTRCQGVDVFRLNDRD